MLNHILLPCASPPREHLANCGTPDSAYERHADFLCPDGKTAPFRLVSSSSAVFAGVLHATPILREARR